MAFDLDSYFKRIDYKGPKACTGEALIEIHRQQCFHIPFEMLDPHLRIAPSLLTNYIVDKLVNHKRGGGCNQINELLALCLTEMGFKVTRLMARVMYDVPDNQVPVLGHKVLLVEFNNEKWLCDTGFGSNGLIEPIPFELNTVFEQFDSSFRLIEDSEYGYALQILVKNEWKPLYGFTLTRYLAEDFYAMHYYNCRNPERVYVKHAIVTMPFVNGRKVLSDRTYKERTKKGTETIEIKDVRQYHDILKQKFDIELPNHPLFFPR